MAHTVSSQQVLTPSPVQNVDSSGNIEQRGAIVCGHLDITSYGAPESVNAAELGLNVIYQVIFACVESAEHEVHAAVVAAGRKSVSVTIDDVGTGTEAGSDNVGDVAFIAFGEALGSGSN